MPATITPKLDLLEISCHVQAAVNDGAFPVGQRILGLVNIANDIAEGALKHEAADAELRADLKEIMDRLGGLSEDLCEALSRHAERHHPMNQVEEQIRQAAR